jgi:hypothetical protein
VARFHGLFYDRESRSIACRTVKLGWNLAGCVIASVPWGRGISAPPKRALRVGDEAAGRQPASLVNRSSQFSSTDRIVREVSKPPAVVRLCGLAVVLGQVCGVFALCFLPGPRPRRRFSCHPSGFEGFAGRRCNTRRSRRTDASTALLSHVGRSTSGCRQTYAAVDILVACAHGAEVPTPLQPRIAHASPYRPICNRVL